MLSRFLARSHRTWFSLWPTPLWSHESTPFRFPRQFVRNRTQSPKRPRLRCHCRLELLLLVLVAACSLDRQPPTAINVAQHSDVTPKPSDDVVDYNEHLAMIAARVPGGFGGMYYDDSRRLTIVLKDLSQQDMALSKLLDHVSRHPDGRVIIRDDISVVQGAFDFRDLYAWYKLFKMTPGAEHVSFGDIDESANKIRLGVPAYYFEDIRLALSELSVPESAVILEDAPYVVDDASVRDRIRPVVGGIQHQYSSSSGDICTISFNITHWKYGQGFVTAAHCTAVDGGVSGNESRQPTWNSGNRLGVERVDSLYSFGIPGCPFGRRCRYSDAAFYEYDDSLTSFFHLAKIAKPDQPYPSLDFSGHYSIDLTEPITGGLWPLAGWTVHKVGRTTGWTTGVVSGTCVDVNKAPPNDRTVLCVNRASYHSDGGDSGAPVFTIGGLFGDPDHINIMGVHFARNEAGDRFFSKIRWVRSELEPSSSHTCSGVWINSPFSIWC